MTNDNDLTTITKHPKRDSHPLSPNAVMCNMDKSRPGT